MNWIRENKFWSTIVAICLVIVAVVGYLYYSTPLSEQKEQVQTHSERMKNSVRQSENASEQDAEIPPTTLIDQLKEEERLYREDIGEMLEYFLTLGNGIEKWITEDRAPKTGPFESMYREQQEILQNKIDGNFASVEEDTGGILSGSGGSDDQQRINWPEERGENMQRTQKEFWIIKRFVHDLIASGATSFRNFSFESQPEPITILDGQPLADRFRVSCEVVTPPEKTGRLLATLLQVRPESGVAEMDPPELMMHIADYQVSKRKTTSRIISSLTDENSDRVRFEYPIEVRQNFQEWTLGSVNMKETLPEQLHTPGKVNMQIQFVVYDPNERTIASLLKEAGYGEEELKDAFRPFFTEEEFQSFLEQN